MKRIILLATLILLPLSAFSVKKSINPESLTTEPMGNYTVTGDFKGLNTEKVIMNFLVPRRDSISLQIFDSALVVDGHFVLKGTIQYPTYAELRTAEDQVICMFWLEHSDIHMKGIVGVRLSIEGSMTEDEHHRFGEFNNTAPLRVKFNEITQKMKDAMDAGNSEEAKRLEAEGQVIVDNWNATAEQFIKENPNSYISLNQVWNGSMIDKLTYEDLSRQFNYLSEKLRNSTNGLVLQGRLEKMKLLTVGQPMPELAQPDIDGNRICVTDYKGKYVLFQIAASWNEMYRNENKVKLDLYNRFHNKGFEIMDVLLDKKKTTIQKVLDEDKMPWKVTCDFKGWDNEVNKRFVIEQIPQSILIDPNGIIIARDLYGERLEKKLTELFN